MLPLARTVILSVSTLPSEGGRCITSGNFVRESRPVQCEGCRHVWRTAIGSLHPLHPSVTCLPVDASGFQSFHYWFVETLTARWPVAREGLSCDGGPHTPSERTSKCVR